MLPSWFHPTRPPTCASLAPRMTCERSVEAWLNVIVPVFSPTRPPWMLRYGAGGTLPAAEDCRMEPLLLPERAPAVSAVTVAFALDCTMVPLFLPATPPARVYEP